MNSGDDEVDLFFAYIERDISMNSKCMASQSQGNDSKVLALTTFTMKAGFSTYNVHSMCLGHNSVGEVPLDTPIVCVYSQAYHF